MKTVKVLIITPLLIALAGCGVNGNDAKAIDTYKVREAEFNQLCRTRAGYKINRVVTEVEVSGCLRCATVFKMAICLNQGQHLVWKAKMMVILLVF